MQNQPDILLSTKPEAQKARTLFHVDFETWSYLALILLSIIAAALVIYVFPGIAVRPVIIFWFLLTCPGMTVVRFFRLHEPLIEWLLALALSITIDAAIAGILLYAGLWSPLHIFLLLTAFCLIGSLAHHAPSRAESRR